MKKAEIIEIKVKPTVVFKCPECGRLGSLNLPDLRSTNVTCYNNECREEFKIVPSEAPPDLKA